MQYINIVVPMAGMGTRFYESGFQLPKPFIDIKGKMMIERVLDNVRYPNAKHILIARNAHLNDHHNKIERLKSSYNVEIIGINNVTDGAACTLLAAHRLINNDTPLIIANSDQIVDMDLKAFVQLNFTYNLDGLIVTFKNSDKKWSYAKVDKKGFVVEVREKKPISDNATVGIYLFSRGRDFINGVMDMIANADKTNNEYYVCPVYNYLSQKRVKTYEINQENMHSLGTPEDLAQYLNYLNLLENKNIPSKNSCGLPEVN